MNPIAAHGNSGWTQATKTASRMGENLSSRSESSSTLDYKLIAQLPHNIKLQHCGDHQLVPQGWTTPTPGEQCRTQVPTSAGCGDLRPKLGEETAPPLVQDQRAASRRAWQCYTVLVIVVTKPLWYSAGADDEFSFEVLATKPATKFLGAFVNSCYDNYSNWLFSAVSYTSMETVDDGYTYHNKVLAISHRGSATCLLDGLAACSLYLASKNGTSDLSLNTRGAQVWRVTKHRPG